MGQVVALETAAAGAAAIRPAEAGDLAACGAAMYEGFRDIATRHGFAPDFPDPATAEGLLRHLHGTAGFDGFVAERDGAVLGSVFVSRRSPVGGVSVITVDPRAQDRAVGRGLMQHAMAHLSREGHPRQQLVQAAYHNRSLSLYAKLGFAATEVLSNMTGPPIREAIPGRTVRPATAADLERCNELCRRVHGFDRAGEVASAIAAGGATVVEHEARVTGYTTGVGFTGHGLGERTEDVQALIAAADGFAGPGILIPTRNAKLFRWCLDRGLRVVQQMILMDTAPGREPQGAWWPSVLC